MPKVEIDMTYEQIKARKMQIKQQVDEYQALIDAHTKAQQELVKWEALEAQHRPKKTVDPYEGLPEDSPLRQA